MLIEKLVRRDRCAAPALNFAVAYTPGGSTRGGYRFASASFQRFFSNVAVPAEMACYSCHADYSIYDH